MLLMMAGAVFKDLSQTVSMSNDMVFINVSTSMEAEELW